MSVCSRASARVCMCVSPLELWAQLPTSPSPQTRSRCHRVSQTAVQPSRVCQRLPSQESSCLCPSSLPSCPCSAAHHPQYRQYRPPRVLKRVGTLPNPVCEHSESAAADAVARCPCPCRPRGGHAPAQARRVTNKIEPACECECCTVAMWSAHAVRKYEIAVCTAPKASPASGRVHTEVHS